MRYEFGDCDLDIEAHALRRAGEVIPIEPQVFDLLVALARNAGVMVSKDDLIDAVWGGRIVSDSTISARISAARTAVGDNGRDQSIIRTVSRRGFMMVAKVTVFASDANAAAAPKPAPRQVIRYASSQDGTSIAWSSAGDGPPVLYAWHHFSHLEKDWTSTLLSPALAALAEHHCLIRHDIRGCGLSEPMQPEATIDDHVADMKAVADAAGLTQFPIVATLQAATVAIRFAALYPDRVSRLVLHNAYARGRAIRNGAPENAENDPFIALLKSGGWGDPANGFMRAWATMVLPMASSDETTELIRLIAHSGTAQTALHHRTMIDRFDVSADLTRVRARTLVIHARLCSLHPVAEGRRVAAGIPAAEFVEVDSSNTFLIGSDPTFTQVMDATLEFLSDDDTRVVG
jgi:DNA-binding winged helix-turn-helix (wHTH) protein/pimeloyl-ACP methyl ester carboxylesterase